MLDQKNFTSNKKQAAIKFVIQLNKKKRFATRHKT